MELQIKRTGGAGKKKFLGGVKFEYSCDVQLLASDEEKDLWNKYEYNKEYFFVSNNEESFKANIEGINGVSFDGLLEGRTWRAKELYVVFTEIPAIIAQQLVAKHAELNAREQWDGQDEVLDLSEE